MRYCLRSFLFYIGIEFIDVLVNVGSRSLVRAGNLHFIGNRRRCIKQRILHGMSKSFGHVCRKGRVASASASAEIPCTNRAGAKFLAVICDNLCVVGNYYLLCSP